MFLSCNLILHNLLQNPNISSHLCKLYSRKAVRGGPTFVRQPNPGLQKQLQLYKNIQLPDEKTQMIDENFDDNLESDFMESGKVYGQYKREQRHEKESRHLKNIDRKYFKEKKNPNLLTWGEKEQIRYLHEMNREEWSVERLAASFPASNDIIKKVLNSTWKPENAARVLTHDEHVRKNWSLLTEGKLDINPDLKAHVSKFTPRRDLITSEAETTTAVAIPQKPRGKVPEFSNIIKQYKDLLEENGEIKNEICESFSSKEKYVPYNIESSLGAKKKHHFTLNEYRGNHTSKCELNEVQESNEPGNEVIQLEATSMLKFRPKNISVKKHASVMNQLKILNDDNIVDKIKIPKNKWQAGATYRVKDCYYDDDGRFLYRVPGMIHE